MKGRELRQLRTGLGWTQATLAIELGVTANSVARMERGERTITGSMSRLIVMVVERAERGAKKRR